MIRPFSKVACGVSALAVIGLALSAQTAGAAFYGNFNDGPNFVSFLNVGDLNGLYGAPTVSVNSLDFSPNGFLRSRLLSQPRLPSDAAYRVGYADPPNSGEQPGFHR